MIVGEDWSSAFYGDECIVEREWSGMSTYGIPTDIPVMGFDDAIEATQSYIVAGEYPRIVIYDASEDTYYDANAYDNHIFEGALLAMYAVHEIKVERDCLGELGGHAYEDNCGVCDLDPENDCPFDCYGVPGGEAFFDDCGICSGGDTGHVPIVIKMTAVIVSGTMQIWTVMVIVVYRMVQPIWMTVVYVLVVIQGIWQIAIRIVMVTVLLIHLLVVKEKIVVRL